MMEFDHLKYSLSDLKQAFFAGFDHSGEGFNSECGASKEDIEVCFNDYVAVLRNLHV